MINIENLTFGYKAKKTVLENVNLELKSGRIYGLLGKNGIGKTTLLKLISGLLFPDSGTVNVNDFTPTERKVSFLSDLFFLSEDVYESKLSIEKFAKLSGCFYPNFSKENFELYLKEFEIEDTKARIDKLSYGTRKKVFIAFGLACRCSVLLLDEPTNGLDIPSKAQFRKVMLKAMNEKMSVVISTHQVRDLHNLIDAVIILDQTNVLLNATADEICDKILFSVSEKTMPNDKLLYSEDTLEGIKTVRENLLHEESNLDIELLFNAVFSNKSRFRELFSPTQKGKE